MAVHVRFALPPVRLCCEPQEVHVWRVELDHHAWNLTSLLGILDEKEIDRVGRFIRPGDSDRFIICRAGLRLVLSRYLNVGAETIRFSIDENGKPWLNGDSTAHGLHFSVSNSAAIAFCAVCSGSEIGVDVERLDGRLARQWIADRFFRFDQAARLAQMSGDSRIEGFFRYWTAMEAYVKARGRGLAGACRDEIEDRSGWSFYDLSPRAGYVGTLVVAGSDHRLMCYDLSPFHSVFG